MSLTNTHRDSASDQSHEGVNDVGLDKHTRRYFGELYDCLGKEKLDFNDIAKAVDHGGEDGYIYNAIDSLSSEVERKVLEERMLKKRMGWD